MLTHLNKALTALEDQSGQEGAKQPEERRMTARASSRQFTKHSAEEQWIARNSLSSRRVNWRKSSGLESSNGQEEADPPGR